MEGGPALTLLGRGSATGDAAVAGVVGVLAFPDLDRLELDLLSDNL